MAKARTGARLAASSKGSSFLGSGASGCGGGRVIGPIFARGSVGASSKGASEL
ncbi:hypothetical protein [Bartonella birtlesii]|uniref:hypothetical protein n=1 Tax=Bartonella birtlesii TaxID=111504 RepID=UPI000317F659|nr:hypothetical protein [Bartonella birtlesii]